MASRQYSQCKKGRLMLPDRPKHPNDIRPLPKRPHDPDQFAKPEIAKAERDEREPTAREHGKDLIER